MEQKEIDDVTEISQQPKYEMNELNELMGNLEIKQGNNVVNINSNISDMPLYNPNMCQEQLYQVPTNMNSNNMFSQVPNMNSNKTCFLQTQPKLNKSSHTLTKIDQQDDKTLPVVSIIVTIYEGSSYDNLFREIKQKAPEGRVSVYWLSPSYIEKFLQVLQNGLANVDNEKDLKEDVKTLIKEMNDLEPDCVLFNWECCSAFSDAFRENNPTMNLIKFLLDRKHMTMFSDFAMKSLIKCWDQSLLGPNPFVKIGECSGHLDLQFNSEELINCPSAQLKMVGKLSNGSLSIHALGGTIVFTTVENQNNSINEYTLKILTVVTKTEGYDVSKHYLNGQRGTIGHALITYKSGGVMIVSAGHWIELSNIDLSLEKLESVANMYDGNIYLNEINDIKNNSNFSASIKSEMYNNMAKKFVQQSAPCNYSQKMTKSFK